LDTQVLIWWLHEERRLSREAFTLISDSDQLLVSVASLYEIDFKRRDPARLRAGDRLLRAMPDDMPRALPELGMHLVSLDAATAWHAANLPMDHGDPWDRILLAQALILRVPLVSADQGLRAAAEADMKSRGVIIF